MPIIQELVDYKELFKTSKYPPILLNDIDVSTAEEKQALADAISLRFDDELISTLPTCPCRNLIGQQSVGAVCPKCNQPVKSRVDGSIDIVHWFKSPDGVADLFNLHFLLMLINRFTKSKFSLIQWLIDTNYNPPVKIPDIANRLIDEYGFKRGYNNFVENFDTYLPIMFSLSDFRVKRNEIDHLKELYIRDRDKIFSNIIPIPNRLNFPVEKTVFTTYVDPSVIEGIDALLMLAHIGKTSHDSQQRVKENRVAKALIRFTEFYKGYYKNTLDKKNGQLRKHVFSSRSNFSCRCVVSSLTDPHTYDELHVPWAIGTTLFKYHVMNKLYKRNWTHNEILEFINSHVNVYHPLLDQIFHEFIEESRDKKLWNLLQRNPSLLKGSDQKTGITKFKTDVEDNTITMSILIVKPFNADFDGDSLNSAYCLDNAMADNLTPLETHFSTFQLTAPQRIHRNVELPAQVSSNISGWLDTDVPVIKSKT